MANKFVARKGLIALNDSSISGSLSISGSVSASIYYGDGRQLILNSNIVSSSEQLALDISGAFTEISSGFDGRITNLESFSSSLDTTFATELEVSGYVEQISTSFETRVTTISTSFDTTTTLLDGRVNLLELTASDHTNRVDFLEITGSNHEVRIDSLESFSSSLDATYATEAELNTSTESVLNDYGLFSSSVQVDITQTTGYTEFSNSIDVTTDALDGRVTDLETFSASIDTIFSTESEVSGYVESVSTSFDTTIDNLSSSLDGRLDVLEGTFSTSVDTRLDDLESFSSSLDTTFATEAELNTATESVLNDYNLISQSHQDVSLSGSFSGSFYGDGSNLTGVTSYTDTDTLDYINELGVLSGSNQNLTGSFTGSFIGDGSGLVDIISASYAQTASYALNAGAGAGFPFSGSAVITGSLFVSGGNISGSFVGDGSGLTNIPISALTGSFNLVAFENTSSVIINHELNTTYPLVQVYDNTNSQIIPESVTIIDSDTIQIDFATNRSGHVMLGSGGDLIEVIRDFPTYLTVTASFSDSTSEVVTHNLGTKNVIVQVYDGGNNQILPQNINVTNENNVTVTFSTNESGYVVVSKAGHLVTGSLLYENILNLPTLISSSEQIASDISGAFTEVSSSLDFRLDNLEDFSTSLDDTFATDLELGQATESILANYGIVSGSSQISYPNISNIPAGIISGAAQLAGETIPGNLTVDGVLTAQEFHTQFVSASIIYQSGSTQFGNSADDTHIFSGSLNISGGLSVNNLNYPISDNGEFSFIQTDGNGNLSLQYVNTIYETIVNGESFQIPKGSPLYVSGSQGAESIVYLADAGDATKMPVTYLAADNIDSGASGRGIVLGLITGVDTTGYAPGSEIYVGVGGGWTATRPSGSAIAQLLGIVTKEGNGGQGLVLNPGPYNTPNLESGQIFWADANDNVVKKPLADILSGSNYVYSGSFSGSFVGDGSQLSGVTSYTDADVLSYLSSGISGSILPSTTDTYDLGSPTNRWRDLYLSGSTLYLGETKLSRNTDGDLEIKDSQNNRKNLIAESIQLVRGNHHIQLTIDDSGRFKQTNATNDAEVTNLGSFSGSFTGSFIGDGSNLSGVTSYTDADTLSYINTLGVVSSSAQISITESQISDLTHYTNSDTLSYINSIGVVSGSVNWDTLSGRPSGIISSSAQLSNATVPGNFTVGGILTAQEFHTEFVSASIIYQSGSTQFGNTIDDTHTFIGTISATTIQNVISSSAQVDYNSIQNKPTIPTNNNQLTNGAGYTTCIGDITGVTAGTGLSGGGTSGTVTVSHADTSTLTGAQGSAGISSITVDALGHVTAVTTATYCTTDTNTTYTANEMLTCIKTVDGAGSGLDADLLDGNQASAFYLATNPSGYTTCTGTLTGTGTSGYLSKWNGSTSQTNSIIYDNGTNVGIGTTSPSTKLEVKTATDSSTSVEGLRIYNDGGGIGAGVKIGLGVGATYSEKGHIRTDIVSGGAGRMFFGVDGSDVITIDNLKNVGIGTTSPSNFTNYSTLSIDGTNGGVLNLMYNGTNAMRLVGESVLSYIYEERNVPITISTNSTERMRIDAGGNVGIGTTSPSNKLEVNGTFYTNIGNTSTGCVLFEHEGSNNPVPFSLRKTGYGGTSNSFGILHLDMNHSCVGGGSNLYFRLLDSTGDWTEYAGIGGVISDNTNGSEDGDLYFYNVSGGSSRTVNMKLLSNGSLIPGANGTQNLGSSTLRWNTVYTSDLSLKNDVGDWTIVEGEEDLFLYNNKKDKVYKFNLTEVDKESAPKKRS